MEGGLQAILGARGHEALLGMVARADLRVDGLIGVGGRASRCFGARKERIEVGGQTLFAHSTGLFRLAAASPHADRFTLNVAGKGGPSPVVSDAERAGVRLRLIPEPDWVQSNALQVLAVLALLLRRHAGGGRARADAAPDAPGLDRQMLLLGCCDQYKKQPDYAESELRAVLAARETGRLVFIEQSPESVPNPNLAELGVTLVEVAASAPGVRFGPIRSMREKDPDSSQYAPDRRLVVGINTMVAAGGVRAWLDMIGAVRPDALRLVLDSAAEAAGPEAAAQALFAGAQGTALAALDFSLDLHAKLPPSYEHYALHHDVPWDDKGMLPQLRPGPDGVYTSGADVRAEGCRAVSAIAEPDDVSLHLLGVEGLSVVVRKEGGRTHVYLASDAVPGRRIREYLRQQAPGRPRAGGGAED